MYVHKTESMSENETHKIKYFQQKPDQPIQARISDFVIVNLSASYSKQESEIKRQRKTK